MSVAMMTAVWRLDDMSVTDKMVLLALADAASDDGITWIAVRSKRDDKLDLLRKCSLSERAIQGALVRLCERGLLSRVDRPGRGTIWTVTPAGNAGATPAADAPRPAAGAGAPAAGAGNPSLKRQLSLIPSGDAPVEKPSRRKPSKPIPESFPDEPCLTWAREQAAKTDRNLSVEREAERFRNHAHQHDRRCADWTAAWRNWVDKAIERAPSLGIAMSAPAPADADPWPARARAWILDTGWPSADWGPNPDSPKCHMPRRYIEEALAAGVRWAPHLKMAAE